MLHQRAVPEDQKDGHSSNDLLSSQTRHLLILLITFQFHFILNFWKLAQISDSTGVD